MRGHGVRGHKAPAKRVHTQKGAKPERGLTVENSENGMNLYKISESGLEELSIVESEDLYGSDDNL